ncbi:MAG: flagellar basal-body MS-ring/collar protein FliF [Rhodomicrobium sp.]
MAGNDQLERLWISLIGLGPRRLAALAAVGLAIFSFVGFGSYYLSRPDLEVLYVGLAPAEVTRIGAVLREAGVSFDVNAEATKVFVKRGEAAKARMLLAERGLPNSSTAGYELFDKLGSMGLTSFMQNITRLRALEGEIARTIQAMRGVKAARVHIVLPDPGSFRHAPQPTSASVLIRTDSREMPSAAAIRQLVSAAVPGMVPEQVAVLTTDGVILAAGGEISEAASGKMLDLEKQVSQEISENVRKTLIPFLGLGNFETSVTARLNLDKKQINETAFDPDSKVERSTRTIKESGNSQNNNTKWNVSVEQNIPNDQAVAKPADQSRRTTERKEETTNFEVSSKTITTVSDGYKIENIAVAVVVNRKHLITAGENKPGYSVEEQIKSIERLAASAAGLQPARGDKVTVAAVDFASGSEIEPVPAPAFWEQFLSQAGSYITAAAILLSTMIFVSLGLRPALRLILESKRLEYALPTPQLAADAKSTLAIESGEPALELEKIQALGAAPPSLKKPSPLNQVEKAVNENEEQAAAILREWMKES